MNVDFIVVVAYGNLVSEEIINHPRYFTINVHASLLPNGEEQHLFKDRYLTVIKKQVLQ